MEIARVIKRMEHVALRRYNCLYIHKGILQRRETNYSLESSRTEQG